MKNYEFRKHSFSCAKKSGTNIWGKYPALTIYPEKVEVHGTVINFKGNEEEFYDNKRKPKNRYTCLLFRLDYKPV